MIMPRLFLFLDTTEFSHNSSLDAPAWDSLQAGVSDGLVRIGVSEITILELQRQIEEKVVKFRESIGNAVAGLGAHLLTVSSVPEVDETATADAFRRRLGGRGVEVLPIADKSHDLIVARDLAARKPFNRNGKGYRDTLIWESFLQWLRDTGAGSDSEIFFLSRNTTDFAESDQLHADLVADLPAETGVTLTTSLSVVVRRVRELRQQVEADTAEVEEPKVVRAATNEAVRQFKALAGRAWEEIDGFPFDLAPVEEVAVADVEVDESTVEADLLDTVSDTGIWDVRASVLVHLEGMVHRGDASRLDPAWSVSFGALDDRYHEATRTISCTLVADVRVEADAETTDGAIVEFIVMH
jgi:hypothetical protein